LEFTIKKIPTAIKRSPYDALNRLTSAQTAGTDYTAKVLQNKSEYWDYSGTYDAWGNMPQK
jgi:hypothetical protein